MNPEATPAERLRAEFDRSFALPPREIQEVKDFVLVAVGQGRYALELAGLSSIEHGLKVVSVPSRVASLAGIAGVRGAVLPVFSLAVLLGLESGLSEQWYRSPVFARVASRTGEMLGVAFDRLLQFARVPETAVYRGEGGTSVAHEDEMFTVVQMPRLLDGLTGETEKQ